MLGDSVDTMKKAAFLNILKKNYDMETDWTGSLYVGITLNWNYQEGYVDISMPKYVQKNLVKYKLYMNQQIEIIYIGHI